MEQLMEKEIFIELGVYMVWRFVWKSPVQVEHNFGAHYARVYKGMMLLVFEASTSNNPLYDSLSMPFSHLNFECW